jgi:hypothetical protein
VSIQVEVFLFPNLSIQVELFEPVLFPNLSIQVEIFYFLLQIPG